MTTIKNKKSIAGTSLIEILVVIVVFLVGILALVQIFPPGFVALRATAGNLLATTLADAEIERLASKKGEIAEYIATVRHISTPSGLAVIVDASQPTRDLLPPRDPITGVGQLNSAGDIVFNSGTLGEWTRTGASNKISRVFAESHTITAPRTMAAGYGSLVALNFAPIYYFLLPSGVGEPGVLQIYGNEMTRKMGDQASAAPIPASFGEAKDWEFYFVEGEKTSATGPFSDLDQIWFGPADTKDVRIALSFVYDAGAGKIEQYDTVISLSLDPFNPPPFASIIDNYWVISLPALVGQPDIYGRSLYLPANVLSVYRDSVRMQRLFQELPIGAFWDANNPYQYKVVTGGFGTILVNPAAFDFTVKNESGISVRLRANADYTVFDWRIMRDEFRIPPRPGEIKLVMSGLQPLDGFKADGRRNTGIGIVGPTFKKSPPPAGSGGTVITSPEFDPGGPLTVRSDDFVLLDLDTGGIIIGNAEDATNPLSGYQVDKTRGAIQLRDTSIAPGSIDVLVAYATGNVVDTWDVVMEDVSGHVVRAMYMAKGEWSVQLYRSAARYRTTDIVAANGLQVSECYIGGSRLGVGDDDRLYFPLSDLGQRVNVGEIYYRDSSNVLHVLKDKNILLTEARNVQGIDHASVQIKEIFDSGGGFDFTMGYAVRRVRGASMTVRVLHNESAFNLGTDPIENYRRLEDWARNWRKHETESYVLGGAP